MAGFRPEGPQHEFLKAKSELPCLLASFVQICSASRCSGSSRVAIQEPDVIRRFLKRFVRRAEWWIWCLATAVGLLWLAEFVWADEPFLPPYLVPFTLVLLLLSHFLQRRFWRLPRPENRETRIAVIGAGPAGLAAAYFLKRQGYREVLVLEKLGRVGGLCRTITEDYYCFDLGANYVTPAYDETLALAYEVGAELYVERPLTTIDFEQDPPKQQDPWDTVREGIGGVPYILLCLKYLWLRWRIGSIVNTPGHERIHEHPELCVSFQKWLDGHGLGKLQRLFEAPITVMGYGYLKEIPAPYALKYMSLRTFMALCLKAFPLTKSWYWWPKRFVLGFQRLWEAVSWTLNVRFNVDIKSIERRDGKVQIKFTHREQILNATEPHKDEMEFDRLVLACPLTNDVLGSFLDISKQEKELFGKIETESYCLTSFTTKGVEMPNPIAAALPLSEIGMPWAITKQMAESNLFQFYSRVSKEMIEEAEAESARRGEASEPDSKSQQSDAAWKEHSDPLREVVVGKVRDVVCRLGGDVQDDQWHTYDRWPYFQHVSEEEMAGGYYQRLEALQGEQNTFYVGAVMNFELVESCIAYSRHMVEKHFDRPRN